MMSLYCFFNATATTEIYTYLHTLSLHDALPILRRQIRRNFRKPLIIMTPKSLLRHKRCISRLADMGPDTSFHRVLRDDADKAGALLPDSRKIGRAHV